ncbi:MAG: deoxynucleoside kinase [Flavobacteriales bacterium]|nr:deoxynucleoside kinase [Flavobacteriales bacterium]
MKTGRIELVGPMGIGKTTFLSGWKSSATFAASAFEGLQLMDPEREYWRDSVVTRSYFMQTVYYIHGCEVIEAAARQNSVVVSDFSLLFHHYGYSRTLREMGYLTDLEYRTLERLLNRLNEALPPLIGAVHCKVEPSVVLARIRSRNRPEEVAIKEDFLKILSTAAQDMVLGLKVPVLQLDLTPAVEELSWQPFEELVRTSSAG